MFHFLNMLMLVFSGFSLSANALDVVYTKTVYDENTNFRTAVEARMTKGPEGFTGTRSKRINLGDYCAATLLDADQAFSLSRMRDIGYITEEEYLFYSRLSAGLEPEQVLFFNQYRTLKLSEARALSIEDQKKIQGMTNDRRHTVIEMNGDEIGPFTPEAAFLLAKRTREAMQDPTIYLKDASLFVVKGQGWDPYLKRRFFKLPWMKESEFARAADFSRIETPLTFEIGRAAQIDEGKFSDLLKLAVVEMAEEARIYGIDPARVKVFGHARDRAHRILYEKNYGFQIFAENSKSPGDWVMGSMLAELIMVFPETQTLEILRRIEVASDGILSGEKASAAYAKFRDEILQALDAAEGVDYPKKPVVLMNGLYEVGGLVAERLVPMGIPVPRSGADVAIIDRVLKSFTTRFQSSFGLTPSMMADPLMELRPMPISKRALQIYNLDAHGLTRDPDYVLRTLFGVREFYRRRVEEFHRVFRSVTTMPEPLYALITTDAEIRDAASALGGKTETSRIPSESSTIYTQPKAGDRIRGDFAAGELYTIYFTDAQIRGHIGRRSELNTRSLSLFKRGKWQERLRLNSGAIHF